MTATTPSFAAGQLLTTRFVGDSQTIVTGKVLGRTAKRITLQIDGCRPRPVTVGILTDSEGAEICYPLGRYSMAPIFRAEKAALPANVIPFAR
jgi:hypothetical protein